MGLHLWWLLFSLALNESLQQSVSKIKFMVQTVVIFFTWNCTDLISMRLEGVYATKENQCIPLIQMVNWEFTVCFMHGHLKAKHKPYHKQRLISHLSNDSLDSWSGFLQLNHYTTTWADWCHFFTAFKGFHFSFSNSYMATWTTGLSADFSFHCQENMDRWNRYSF